MDVQSEIHWKRTVYGFQSWKKIEDVNAKRRCGVKCHMEIYSIIS